MYIMNNVCIILLLVILVAWLMVRNSKDNFNNNKEILNIVTPSIRPENLKRIKVEIDKYIEEYPEIDFNWIIVYDEKKIKPGFKQFNNVYISELSTYHPKSTIGTAQRDYAFKHLKRPGWVYLLDDDTFLIRSVPTLIANNILDPQKVNSITCAHLGDNTEMRPGGIDTGCVIFHTDILGDMSYSSPSTMGDYSSDGHFIEKLTKKSGHIHHKLKDKFIYNALSPSL